MLDITALTLGEIDKIETLSGCSINTLGNDDTPKGKMLAALAYVAKRRAQSAEGLPVQFTWNDALALTMDEANALIGLGETEDEADEDPTDPE